MNDVNEKEIIVAWDLDGCLFGDSYGNKYIEDDNAVVDSNKVAFDKICDDVRKERLSELVLTSFSNRQFQETDENNSVLNQTQLSSVVMPKIYEYFLRNLKECGVKVTLDNYTLSHLYSGTESEPLPVFNFAKIDYTKCYFDESKFMLLYTQVHRAAIRQKQKAPQKGVNIEYRVIDDKYGLLTCLSWINSAWFPKGAVIGLYRYEGKNTPMSCSQKIIGTGEIDAQYKDHVITLSQEICRKQNRTKESEKPFVINAAEILGGYKNLNEFLESLTFARSVEQFIRQVPIAGVIEEPETEEAIISIPLAIESHNEAHSGDKRKAEIAFFEPAFKKQRLENMPANENLTSLSTVTPYTTVSGGSVEVNLSTASESKSNEAEKELEKTDKQENTFG